MLSKALAFLKKDFLVESSYRFAFFFGFFGIFVTLLEYYFINRLFGARIVPALEDFGVNYFSYILLSTAFFGYIGIGMGSFSARIRSEQVEGTIESVLVTPTPINTILFSMTLWSFIFATINMAVYILLGVFVFRIDFSHINILSASVILVLSILSFSSLGILSATFIMIFKRGNPVGWIIGSIEGLLGGVYFPVAVLPPFLQLLSGFLPITYATRAIQLAVYKGYGLGQLRLEVGILLIFSAVLLPLSFAAFAGAFKKARRDGSLAQY